MIKYLPSHTKVVFAEVPDEVTLAIAITGCRFHCPDCHSKELWPDSGKELTTEALSDLLKTNIGITCVCFMGEGTRLDNINARARWIKSHYPLLKVALYTGRVTIPDKLNLAVFDYVKTGPYDAKYGPINKPTTNQLMYRVLHKDSIDTLENITYKFWKKKNENKI